MTMIVSFCGHSSIQNTQCVSLWLQTVVESLIHQGASTFYLGGYGQFDHLAASVIRDMKQLYPHIEAILVLPYLNHAYNANLYDSTIYPPLESIPKRYAIIHRNRWMVRNADTLVACVLHNFGGASMTLKYAYSLKKSIIQYCDHI